VLPLRLHPARVNLHTVITLAGLKKEELKQDFTRFHPARVIFTKILPL